MAATTADGSPITDYGQRVVEYRVRDGPLARTAFHVMNVRKPILSVGLLEERGHVVRFGPNPYLQIGGRRCELVRQGNLYYLPVEVCPSSAAPGRRGWKLFEWCCEPDSELSAWMKCHGEEAQRLCLPNYDMSKEDVVAKVVRQIVTDEQDGYNVAVWISLPCTPWTTWQRINAKLGVRTAEHVQEERRRSVGMLRLMVGAMELLQERIPAEHLVRAFEWP